MNEKKEFDGNTPIDETNKKDALDCKVVHEEGGVFEKPLELNEETVEKVKEAIAEEVRQEAGISDKDSELFKQMCLEADMPVEFLDKNFKLGAQELDIRGLSKKNTNQMFFRTLVLHSVYLKNITTSLLDITRLLLVLLDNQGIADIVKATDDIVDKINEQTEALKQIKKQQNN